MFGSTEINTASVLLVMISSIFLLGWRLNNQFRDVRQLVFTQSEKIKEFFLSKLDYHEKHDDERFDKISNDLWLIRIHNAARDGADIKPIINGKKDTPPRVN
jgi:hypothetical protein